MNHAIDYIKSALDNGTVDHDDLVQLVLAFQRSTGLRDDGILGPITLKKLHQLNKIKPMPVAFPKVYPLPILADLRKPQITSSFKSRNPSRPDHNGCDLFYLYDPTRDPPVKMGDGAATRGPDGKPKWFIPSGLCAIAAAAGHVSSVGPSSTGYRVWVDHLDGLRTGYFHLRNVLVMIGQSVAPGTPLGEVGDNPSATDAEHLHFEVSPQVIYKPQDPEEWLQGALYTSAKR